LLNWVERFAREEGPRLLKEGGKDGVIHAFNPTVKKLSDLVAAAANAARQSSGNSTPGFHTPRVQRAFEELSAHLKATSSLASKIKREPRPSITAVEPEEMSVIKGKTAKVTINEADFQSGAVVRLNRSRQADDDKADDKANDDKADQHIKPSALFVDEAEIQATFQLIDDNVGEWTVIVINPDGQYDALQQAITILPAPVEPPPLLPPAPQPTISGVAPSKLPSRNGQKLNIKGTHLDSDNSTVILMGGTPKPVFLHGNVTKKPDSENIEATFDLVGIPHTNGVIVMVIDNAGHALVPQATLEITGGDGAPVKGRE
jgi:IPT/TIG domain-containing protein